MIRLNIIYKKIILNCCIEKSSLIQIQKRTGVSYSTVLTYTRELYKQGLLVESNGEDKRSRYFKITKLGLNFLNSRNSQVLL